jgi:hypothetical protein
VHAGGDPKRVHPRNHNLTGQKLDGADGAKYQLGGGSSGFGGLERFALPMSQRQLEAIGDRLAHYQPIFRFVLLRLV